MIRRLRARKGPAPMGAGFFAPPEKILDFAPLKR